MYRYPVFAGSFYPAHPQQLHALVSQLLADATCAAKVPKAVIVPHAGYRYSGPVAAAVYQRLRSAEQRIKRVVLMGPSHRVAFTGLAVTAADGYLTPFGDIPIDKVAVADLLRLPFVERIEEAHAQEHSLEVHLPFLQQVLDDFCLVPIVAGDASAEQVRQVLELLWGGPETLIVISSDLSHFHDYATAQQLDQATSQHIEDLDYQAIDAQAACGCVPVRGLLKLLKQQARSIKTVALNNSGDTAGDKQRVVGYGAYVVE